MEIGAREGPLGDLDLPSAGMGLFLGWYEYTAQQLGDNLT